MVDPATTRKLVFQLLFVIVCTVIIFIKMLPLSMVPSRIPAPDLLYCFTAAFVMRRPNQVHPVMIVVIYLLADMLFLRPLGLWPALSLLGFEMLRNTAWSSAELLRSVEIIMATLVFAVLMAANASVYFIFGLEHPSFGQTGLIILVTAMAYPFVILTTEFILGVRRIRRNEI